MTITNEENSLKKDLLAFMQALKPLSPVNTSRLDSAISQLRQPIYQITANNKGKMQICEYAGLVLVELLQNDQELLKPDLLALTNSLEQKIGLNEKSSPKPITRR